MADLADLYNLVEPQERGAEMTVIHPVTGEPMPDIVFIVAGPDSTVQRKARLQFSDELLALRRAPTADEREKIETEMMARCVIGWRVKQGGESIPFSFFEVLKLIRKFEFIRQQLDGFAAQRSPYLPAIKRATDQEPQE